MDLQHKRNHKTGFQVNFLDNEDMVTSLQHQKQHIAQPHSITIFFAPSQE
jgi:hypothetical protein